MSRCSITPVALAGFLVSITGLLRRCVAGEALDEVGRDGLGICTGEGSLRIFIAWLVMWGTARL